MSNQDPNGYDPQQANTNPSGYDPSGFPPPPPAYPQPSYPAPHGGYPQVNAYGQPVAPYGGAVVAAPNNKGGLAIAGFVLGLISLLAWIIPICGLPVAIVGLVLSILGRGSPTRRVLATIGLVLCILGILASLGNAGLGIYLATQTPAQ